MYRFYFCLFVVLVTLIPNIYAQSSTPESGSTNVPSGAESGSPNIQPESEKASGSEKAPGAERAPESGIPIVEKAPGAERAPVAGEPYSIAKSTSPLTDSDTGGCLIATATFGSELAPQVQLLRELRDNTVLSTASGTSFMTAFNTFYYSFSPTVADLERQNPLFMETVKIAITPLLSSLSLLQYVDIDSEAEMLGYGIGIILLNIGMYFVGPVFLIVKLKDRFSKIHA